jgi:hypothetical protein
MNDKLNGKSPAKSAPKASAAARLKEEKASFKYSVDQLATALGVNGSSARVMLRKYKVSKAGRAYGWNTREEFDNIVKKLKGDKAPAKPAAKKPAVAAKKPSAAPVSEDA